MAAYTTNYHAEEFKFHRKDNVGKLLDPVIPLQHIIRTQRGHPAHYNFKVALFPSRRNTQRKVTAHKWINVVNISYRWLIQIAIR